MDEALFDAAIKAAQGANYAILAGAIVMVLVYLWRQMSQDHIPVDWLPLSSAVIGVCLSVGTALLAGVVWYRALLVGLLCGATASGLWSLVGKHIAAAIERVTRQRTLR